MKVAKFDVSGPLLIEPKVFTDERGYFTERFRDDLIEEAGIADRFIQDNYSLSHPRVLRGLHFQWNPPQGKLVTCVQGRIFDVAVDIRPDSKSFGQWVGVELSSQTPQWLWVPAGFAHGFCVLGDQPAGVLYKVTAPWNASGEGGIQWNDPQIGIDWPVTEPVLSQKDRELPSLRKYSDGKNGH